MNILVTVGIASTKNFENTQSMPEETVAGNKKKKEKNKDLKHRYPPSVTAGRLSFLTTPGCARKFVSQ